VIGAFSSFLKEVEREYPYSYEAGEFAPLIDMLSDLSRETTDAGIRLSDMAVVLARESAPLIERLYFLEKIGEDLKELGSAQAVCAQRLP
jgi:hypothetical protein